MNKLVNFLFLIVVLKNVSSFKLPPVFSEGEMFERHNGNKEVNYLKQISPSSRLSSIGQVGGLATDLDGSLVVFHRGSRRWSFDSFVGQKFNTEKYGPIPENVISFVDSKSNIELFSFGKKRFYMPHGLTIDGERNIWVTDVGLQQVYKFNLDQSTEPELVLGVKFESGNDQKHFCKPTDVAVLEANGDVFVSDGYCNQRVVRFDQNGKFIREYKDEQRPLQIAHSVTLIENLGLVCTVSREEGRIVCFDIESGEKKHEITNADMLTVYAISFDENNQVIHAMTGENHGEDGFGFTFDARKKSFGQLLQKWNAEEKDLNGTHDLAISLDGSKIFSGQLNGEIDEFSYE